MVNRAFTSPPSITFFIFLPYLFDQCNICHNKKNQNDWRKNICQIEPIRLTCWKLNPFSCICFFQEKDMDIWCGAYCFLFSVKNIFQRCRSFCVVLLCRCLEYYCSFPYQARKDPLVTLTFYTMIIFELV